ncbi:hypothetical protein [Immundisolibacter sp.]|uniref:hypothetical protein n=1 Tax=Immundisolibacter sp. TaxID=1934948 RepID=UPI003569B4B6
MKVKIDSALGRRMITARFATVEPVFGNLRGNKRLDRFTLLARRKVDGQWSCIAWCTTSRNWPIMATRTEGDAKARLPGTLTCLTAPETGPVGP